MNAKQIRAELARADQQLDNATTKLLAVAKAAFPPGRRVTVTLSRAIVTGTVTAVRGGYNRSACVFIVNEATGKTREFDPTFHEWTMEDSTP